MKFSELENLMLEEGIVSLADIARKLSTTPQAVSNWKSRDQVPYHIEAKINQMGVNTAPKYSSKPILYEEDSISLSDILLVLGQQTKVIILVSFVFVFLTFTYVPVSYTHLTLPTKRIV